MPYQYNAASSSGKRFSADLLYGRYQWPCSVNETTFETGVLSSAPCQILAPIPRPSRRLPTNPLPIDLLPNYRKQFAYYRRLGERTLAQLTFAELTADDAAGTNSIAVIVKHLAGNMHSRWTDLLTSDGEKPWRNREAEFVADFPDRKALEDCWAGGWQVLETTLASLTNDDLGTLVYIRNEGHPVYEAINRQLAHYSYHVGQIVLLGKQARGSEWQSLSIPRGGSASFNERKFSEPRRRQNFIDGLERG